MRIVGLLLITILAVISYKLGFVDITGLLSSYFIGYTIWSLAGPSIFFSLLIFFISSGLTTKYKNSKKVKMEIEQENLGRRNWKNVVGSGLVPCFCAVFINLFSIYGINPFLLYIACLTSIGTTMADTLASEIGSVSDRKPRLIVNLRKKVPHGSIGAVSLDGEKMAVISGFIVGIFGFVFLFIPNFIAWRYYKYSILDGLFLLVSVILGSFVGCNVDSLIGYVFQNKNLCEICGMITTKEFHCDYETRRISKGLKLPNEFVNLGSSVVGSIVGLMIISGFVVWIIAGIFIWINISE